MTISKLHLLSHHNILQDIDFEFADFLYRLAGERTTEELYLASLLVSHVTTTEKDICLDLKIYSGQPFVDLLPAMPDRQKTETAKSPPDTIAVDSVLNNLEKDTRELMKKTEEVKKEIDELLN